MNYYDALQIQDGPMKGKWHYVSQNRRQGNHPVGYCSRWRDCPTGCGAFPGEPGCDACEGGAVKLPEAEYHAHAHDTADEARECFRRYLLDGAREEEYGDWTGCEAKGCDTPTKKGMTARPPVGEGYAFCDEHRDAEHLEALMGPVGQITASY